MADNNKVIDGLRKQIEELSRTNEQWSKRNKELEDTIVDLGNTIADLGNTIASKDQRIQELEQIVDTRDRQLEQVSHQVHDIIQHHPQEIEALTHFPALLSIFNEMDNEYLKLFRWSGRVLQLATNNLNNNENEIPLQNIKFTKNEESEIGRASYGVVYKGDLVMGRDRISVAVKVLHNFLNSSAHAVQEFRRETALACNMSHPNLVKTFGVCNEGTNLLLCMKRESTSLQTLLTSMKRKRVTFSSPQYMKMLLDASMGLNYLHKCKVVHRDLNLGNFLLGSDWTLKVSDFGTCRVIRTQLSHLMTSTPGAPYYLSPEVPTQSYSFSSDIWSFGLVMLDLCCFEDSAPPPALPPASQQKAECDRLIALLPAENRSMAEVLVDLVGRSRAIEAMQRRRLVIDGVRNAQPEFARIAEKCLLFENLDTVMDDNVPSPRGTFGEIIYCLVMLGIRNGWPPSSNIPMPRPTIEEFLLEES